MSDLIIREEREEDYDAVRRVNELAFGRDAEARLVDRLRSDGYTRVSLVAEWRGSVVGHILFSDTPVSTQDGEVCAFALAPLAVVPEQQDQGIGSALVQAGLEACRAQGCRVVIVLGHRGFYPRFGFSSMLARQIDSPYAGEDFMALELEPAALNAAPGRVEYPPPFAAV